MKFALHICEANISLGEAKFHSPQANFVEKSTSALQMCFFLEAPPRFELGNQGVADPCLTAWL